MATYTKDEIVAQEAEALVAALRYGRLKFRKLNFEPGESNHLGSYADVAAFDNAGTLQLWFDHASGCPEPMFWVGFHFGVESDLDKAIEKATNEAKPQYELQFEDIYDVGGDNWLPRAPIDQTKLALTGCERYPDDENFYLGRYFSDYSAEQAVAYIRSLIGLETTLPSGFWEGGVVQYMASRYERDPAAREACLRHHGYRCRVCSLDFAERYGKLGAGFIHVHHTVPLSNRAGGKHTRCDELVPVCPNCHAMLHRFGLRTPDDLVKVMSAAVQ